MIHKHYFIGDINITKDKKTLSNVAKNFLNLLSSNNGSKNVINIPTGVTSSFASNSA